MMTTKDTKASQQGLDTPPEGVAQTREPDTQREDGAQELGNGMPMWMVGAIAVLVSVLVSSIGLVLYKQYGAKEVRVATVDINEVMQIKEVFLTAKVARPEATDKDREAVYDEIARFGQTIEGAIAELQRECGCLLLVRAAVVKGAAEDLTENLKQKVGLGNVTLPAALAVLRGGPVVPAAGLPVAPKGAPNSNDDAARSAAAMVVGGGKRGK